MKQTPPADEENGPLGMTLQRLQQLLDAYGADPEHWPVEERVAALSLLAHSAEACARREDAARLDAVLDRGPVTYPTTDLVARILAAAPGHGTHVQHTKSALVQLSHTGRRLSHATLGNRAEKRPRRRLAWSTFAIAASLALGLWTVRLLTPLRYELTTEVIVNLGVYTTPTDVLLQWPGVETLTASPLAGCQESAELGCFQVDVSPQIESRSFGMGRRAV